MSDTTSADIICAACSTPGTGRFCSNCGASLVASECSSCGASLSPGARFCHACGRPVPPGIAAARDATAARPAPGPATPGTPGMAGSLPWIVAAIALIALLAFLAGSAFNKPRGSTLDAPKNALPQAGLDDRGVTRAPDISSLSPEERADRLFNRVMLLASQGKTDSVLFFAPMAINAYAMLSPLNADQRYDMGRIAEVAGALPLAKAQADTILSGDPNHLLGLILGARVAALTGDSAARRAYATRILSVRESETARKLPEYERHAEDIRTGIQTAERERR